MTEKRKIAFLIPAHNEGEVLAGCLLSIFSIVPKEDIYVVDDGSTDNTVLVAKRFTDRVLSQPRSGKAHALNSAIKMFKLTEKYDYIMPFDADTKINDSFLSEVMRIFESDNKKEIAAVTGKVEGTMHNWATAYRVWEYEVSQAIHKNAQSVIDAVIVCPGCTTVFRSHVFDKLGYPKGTLTEDMDLTFEMHRRKVGKIVFTQKSSVVTEDPRNISDLGKQINRWYTGFWQCLIKHNIPWGGQTLDLEVALLATEGLFNGILVLIFLFFAPILILKNPKFILVPLAFDLFIFMIPTLIFVYLRVKNLSIFKYIPHFYLLRFMSSIIFLSSFVNIVLGIDLKLSTSWNTKRYNVFQKGKEKLWLNPSLQ